MIFLIRIRIFILSPLPSENDFQMNFFPFSTFGATLEEMNTEMRWSDEICLEHPRSSRGGGGEGKISLFVQMTSLFECRNIFKIFNNGKPV